MDANNQEIFKDRKALLALQKGVMDKQEIMVKDLGGQLSS